MKSSRATRTAAPASGVSALNSSACACPDTITHAAKPASQSRIDASILAPAAVREACGEGKAWTRRGALLATIGAAAAFSGARAFAQAGRVDVSLVDPYTEEIAVGFARRRLPFIAAFERSGVRLTFVASRHDVRRGGPTFRAIERAFRARPNALVVEGIPSSWGWNPARVTGPLSAMQRDPAGADSYLRGEPGHAMALALSAGAPFIGGEPDNSAIDSQLLADGATASEIACVKMLQWLPQGLIAGEFEDARDPRFTAFLDRTAARISADFTYALLFNREIYERWHEREFGVALREDRDFARRLDPARRGRAAALSRAMTLIRDRHIFTRIMGVLAEHDRTLVVYGGAHFMTLERALRAALGRPRFV